MALPKAPAQDHLDLLDSVFGSEYFEHGRLLMTVARDVPGAMKVAHRLQSKLNESFGAMVEVIFEHVKHELWDKLHQATTTVGLHKGPEVPECQVTDIPDGIRLNPYQRDQLPTLEVLLLWTDSTRTTRGHVMYTIGHPECPKAEQVDEIYAQIEPFFSKRWVHIQLTAAPAPALAGLDDEPAAQDPDGGHVGGGVSVSLLACHAYGFAARDEPETAAPHVRHCMPLAFRGISDDAGIAKICFLPADINKIQVAESEAFHGTEVTLLRADVLSLDQGPTKVSVKVLPKSLASLTVHVFAMPKVVPKAEETDGIVDWAAEERERVEGATVVVEQLRDGDVNLELVSPDGGASFVAEDGLPEGCVSLTVRCPGFRTEERAVFLLVGANSLYVPLSRE